MANSTFRSVSGLGSGHAFESPFGSEADSAFGSGAARQPGAGWAMAVVAFAMVALPSAVTAQAQPWPAKPIRVIVPFPPGGAADLVARAFSVKLGEGLQQPIILDNRPGADTIIGMDATAKSPPDGYTIVLAINSALSMNPALYSKLPYDSTKDFAPISIVASVPLALVVPPTSPARTAAELGTMLKEKDNKYSYGAGNIVARIGAELMLTTSGGNAQAIMYKGSSPTVVDLMRGEVQFAFEPVAVVMPYVKGGKMRALGVATDKRSTVASDIPTMAESGMPGIVIPVWFGFMAPANTPPAIVNRLHDEIVKASKSPEVTDKLASMGVDVNAGTPEEFASTITTEREVWVKRIHDWDIKIQ